MRLQNLDRRRHRPRPRHRSHRLVVRHAFETERLHRVALEVYAFNPRARRVYEKVGFVVEGTMRDALRFDDGWVDAHLMAIIVDDWLADPS